MSKQWTSRTPVPNQQWVSTDNWYTEFLPKVFTRPTFPREFVIPNFETIAYRNVKRKTGQNLSWMYDKYDNDNYHVYKDINHYHNYQY